MTNSEVIGMLKEMQVKTEGVCDEDLTTEH